MSKSSERKYLDIERLKKEFILVDGKVVRIINYKGGKVYELIPINRANTYYYKVSFRGIEHQYHRIVWVLSTGKDIPEGMWLDHINGDIHDNRIENLRLVTSRENAQNRNAHRDGKLVGSSYKHNRYSCRIRFGADTVLFGGFLTAEEAELIYKFAQAHEEEYHYMGEKDFKAFVLANTHVIRKPRGYSFYKGMQKYSAYVKVRGKRIYVGLYKTEGEAIEASKFAESNTDLYKNVKQFRDLVKAHVASVDCSLKRYYLDEVENEYIPFVFIKANKLELGRCKTIKEAECISNIAETIKAQYKSPEQFKELVLSHFEKKEAV